MVLARFKSYSKSNDDRSRWLLVSPCEASEDRIFPAAILRDNLSRHTKPSLQIPTTFGVPPSYRSIRSDKNR